MQSKHFYIDKEEKFRVIATETPNILLVIAGVLATLLLMVMLYYVGNLMFEKKVFGLISRSDMGAEFYLITALIVVFVGITGSQIRRFEFVSQEVSFKKSEFYQWHFYLLYFFFFVVFFFLAIRYYLPMWMKSSGRGISTILPVLTLLTILFAWLVRNTWDVFFRFFTQLFSPIDWRLIVDRMHFTRMMKIKFAEVMRYQGPLSLMIIGIKNIDDLKKNFSRGKIRKLQYRIVDFVNSSVRHLDLVGRIEEGQFIAALLHTAGIDAKVPAQRVLEKMQDLVFFTKKGKSVPVQFAMGIASFDQSLENELEMINKAKKALRQAMEGEQEIVYL